MSIWAFANERHKCYYIPMTENNIKMGFEPYINADSEILILGSFPSVKSREIGFYYGHPRNRFWSVLSKVFGEELPGTIDEKKALLKRNKIALYDVVEECEIKGSLDSNIKNLKSADIKSVISKGNISRIILNGGKAYSVFAKKYPDLLDMAVKLPSTSPANAGRFDFDMWQTALTKK